MEIRSFFKKVFGTDPKKQSKGTELQFLNGYSPIWRYFDGNLYENPTVRSCVDVIARNGAKLSPKHLRNNDREFSDLNGRIKTLISEKPNRFMNAYDFYYKIITSLYIDNDAFVYVERDDRGNLKSLYPIRYQAIRFFEDGDDIFVKFSFANGKEHFVNYKNLIHLKRHFFTEEMLGGNNNPLNETLKLKQVIEDGETNAIQMTQSLKGILKVTKGMLNDKDIKERRDSFVRDLTDVNTNKGIAGTDSTMEFQEINLNPKTASDKQKDDVNKEVLNYFGLSENILQSKYSEDEWNAFYESVLEPIAIMLGLEFTNKLFTAKEKSYGNKIVFESSRLQYASNKTKIEVARYMNNYMTINEIREVFNLAPIEDGDKIMQDLNHIDGAIANEYQKGGEEE